MTARAKQIISFLFFLVAALSFMDWFILYTIKRCPLGNIAKVNAVMDHRIDAEVTIWGASTARVHFDSEIMQKELGLSCFNLGLDGTPFHQYSGLLEEYISYSKNERALVIAIDINGFGSRNILYQGYSWLHYINNPHIYRAIGSIDPDIAFKSKYVPLYYVTTYDRRFLLRCLKWVYTTKKGETELSHQGFHPSNVEWKVNNNKKYNQSFSLPIDPKVVSRINEVLKRTQELRLKVAIVVPPCYAEAQKLVLNMEQFEKALASFESDNIKVFNYLSSPICYDKTKFSNNTHLNTDGASLFTKEFVKDIGDWIGR